MKHNTGNNRETSEVMITYSKGFMERYYNFLTSFSCCDRKPRLANLHSALIFNANEICQIPLLHRKLTLVSEQSCTIVLIRVGLPEESLLYHSLCFKATTIMARRLGSRVPWTKIQIDPLF